MRAVFDLDDTICVHENRDYKNAKPIIPVIKKMQNMKDDGWEIVIYSARGQMSCNGDLIEIERKNRPIVERWLKEHGVPFDELIFGKPIAEIYVDDKGISADEFLEKPFYNLKGGSGKKIYRIGDCVIKEVGDDVSNFKDWIKDKGDLCKHPRIMSYLYGEVTMQYVEGKNLCDAMTKSDFLEVVRTIELFSNVKYSEFDINGQLEVLYKNLSGDSFDDVVYMCSEKVKGIEGKLSKNASFCHGDMTLCNIIKANDGLYFIDPRYKRNSSSYLLDFAKVRMSLMNYEKRFGISKCDNSWLLPSFDSYLEGAGIYKEVLILNLMYICRLYRYKKDKTAVADMANELIEGAKYVF